jgi:SHS2 domain-containing protein
VSLAGIQFLDHTADVGMDVDAASLEELLHRAALGMMALLRGEDDEPSQVEWGDAAGEGGEVEGIEGIEGIPVSIHVDGPTRLMADWLSEILFLHEVRDLDYVAADLERVEPRHVAGSLLVRTGGHAVREIKGVTYHGLQVDQGPGGGWRARVIFDV